MQFIYDSDFLFQTFFSFYSWLLNIFNLHTLPFNMWFAFYNFELSKYVFLPDAILVYIMIYAARHVFTLSLSIIFSTYTFRLKKDFTTSTSFLRVDDRVFRHFFSKFFQDKKISLISIVPSILFRLLPIWVVYFRGLFC